MDLKNRIKNLADTTTSKEVKELCQTYLNESEGSGIDKDTKLTESLFNDLKKAAESDDLVAELLTEKDSYAVNKRKIEAKISGRAAKQLMENWNGTTSGSPVGNLKDNTLESENQKKAAAAKELNENLVLAAKTDPSAGKVLKDLRVESYGIAEAIKTIKTSKVVATPQLKYAIARFETNLENNVSESRFVKDFLSNIAGYNWDPKVNEAYTAVKTLVDAKSVELEVQNAIQIIAEQDKNRFFDTTIETLNKWLMNENRSIPSLMQDMKQWMFNPVVNDLVKHVQILENSYGNKFNVPVNSGNCSITSIYSPITIVAEGTIFRTGNSYYLSSKNDGITRLSEEQVNGLPVAYTALCENFFNNAVRVSDDGVCVHIGSAKVTMNEHGTFIGESAIDPADLGQKLLFHTQKTMFKSDDNLIKVACALQEGLNQIVEIDYGKAVFSNLYEGVGVNLFRKNDKIYINKVNPAMNEDTFNEANAVQTVNTVKEFLNYDLSESLIDMLDGDLKKKSLMESAMTEVLGSIELVEAEINKIDQAIAENADIADVEEVQAAKEMLETELNKLQSEWHAKSTELEEFTTVMEMEEDEEEDDDTDDVPADADDVPADADDVPADADDVPADADDEPVDTNVDDVPVDTNVDDVPADVDDEPVDTNVDDTADDGDDDADDMPADDADDIPADDADDDADDVSADDDADIKKKNNVEEDKIGVTVDTPADDTLGDPTTVVTPDEITDSGLAGAEGAQIQAQEIAGNDNLDADGSVDPDGQTEFDDNNLVDDGHAGAGENQTQAQSIDGGADATNVAATSMDVEITIPDNIETASVEQQADTSSVEVGDTAADELPADEAPVDDMPTDNVASDEEDAAGDTPAEIDTEKETTTDDVSTVDAEVDAEVEPMSDKNYDEETEETDGEKSNEALNTYLTSKGLDEDEIATIASYIGEDSLAAKLHNDNPQLMAKVMPFVKEITALIESTGARKVTSTKGISRDEFMKTVNEAFSGVMQNMADRLIAAYNNFEVAKPSRMYEMAMHENVAGDITGKEVIEITHKAVLNLSKYNETDKFDTVLEAMDSVLNSKKKNKLNESLDVNVPVRMKGSDKNGVITAINSVEQQYTVLWDGGETGDYGQDQLEELSADIADNDNENQEAAEAATKKAEESDGAQTSQSNVTNEGFEYKSAINDVIDPEGLKKKLDDYIFANFVKGAPTEEMSRKISDTYGDIMFDLKTLQVENVGESIEELAHLVQEPVDLVADVITDVIQANAGMVDDRTPEKKTEHVTESEDAISVWTQAKVTIDFGPFQENEKVEVDAEQFVSSGADDSIKLKDPKDEIKSIPKKYLEIEDGGDNTHTEISDKLDNALKNLEDAETLLQSEDKINKQEISDAVGKVKAFKDALETDD